MIREVGIDVGKGSDLNASGHSKTDGMAFLGSLSLICSLFTTNAVRGATVSVYYLLERFLNVTVANVSDNI